MICVDAEHLKQDIENVYDSVLAIMALGKLLTEVTQKAYNGEDVDYFVTDGLCKSITIAAESIGQSVDNMREIVG